MTDLDFPRIEFKGLDKRVNLQSLRVLSFLIDLFPDSYDVDSKSPVSITVSVQDFAKYFQLNIKNGYRDVSSAIKKLVHAWVVVENDGCEPREFAVFTSVSYSDGEGEAILEINKPACALLYKIKNLRSSLKRCFVPMPMCNTVYGHLLCNFLFTINISEKRRFSIKLDDLRKVFSLEGRYPKFADFRRRSLDSAIADVNQKTGWNVQYSKDTDRGRVVGITFYVGDLES